MAKFQFLPAETKFYEWFEKATGNLLEAAEALEDLLDHYEQVESKVARITELEHRGDFIVHEVMHLLMHTLIIPLDGEDVERLISALDDSVDKIEATAVRCKEQQASSRAKDGATITAGEAGPGQRLGGAPPVADSWSRRVCTP